MTKCAECETPCKGAILLKTGKLTYRFCSGKCLLIFNQREIEGKLKNKEKQGIK